ncbi:hypothetical protein GYMLUDRAFT_37584 [Collybiopsis luxurians FD-317 M1]|nr:hypothetical protein GYMLUDRAFT_37584 [Collybiopsis luxurians FD-317 M1]
MPTNVSSLPSELLISVFKFTLSTSSLLDTIEYFHQESVVPLCPWPNVFDLQEGPWVLAKVCARWRFLALSIPELWSTFFVPEARGCEDTAAEILRTWLERSRDLPLRFQIIATSGFFDHKGYPLLDLLLACASRWRSLELVDVCLEFLCILGMEPQNLPYLKELSFLTRDDRELYGRFHESTDPLKAFLAFSRAPNLDTLISLSEIDLSPSFHFHWNQLKTYVASESLDSLWEIFTRCSDLVECDSTFGYHSQLELNDLEPVVLTQLKRWTFRIVDAYHVWPYESIQLPSLRELILLGGTYLIDPALDFFTSALRITGTLRYLELSGITQRSGGAVARFLTAVSTITRVRIWLRSYTVATTILLLLHQDLTLLPELDTLDIRLTERSDIIYLDMSHLASAVRSRSASPSVQSISRLNIVMDGLASGDIDPHIFPPIMEVLQEEGLQIRICDKTEEIAN